MFKKIILSSAFALSFQANSAPESFTTKTAGYPTVNNVTQSNQNQLLLKVGIFDPLIESLDFNKSNITTKKSSKYSIVQFKAGKADSNWLRSQGIKIVSYLPNNAFVILKDTANTVKLKNNETIRWQGDYLSNYKIDPELWENSLKNSAKQELSVSFFNGTTKQNALLLMQKNIPNIKAKFNRNSRYTVINLTVDSPKINSTLKKLSSIEDVQFVEKKYPLLYSNTEAVSAVQSNTESGGTPTNDIYSPNNTPIWDKGLIGSGQIVGVADSGLDTNEDWFAHYDDGVTVTSQVTEAQNTTPPAIGTLHPNNKVIGYFVMPGAESYDEAGAGYHGTHVTGSIAGDRVLAIEAGPGGSISSPQNPGYDNDDGMAPNAQILFQDLGAVVDIDGTATAVLSGQGSSPMWEQAYNAGARIHSNSYGSETNGQYTFGDLFADFSLRKQEDMIILFASGNDGANENSVGSPAVAKNVVSVGALAHGNSPFEARLSNRGPTDDGRIKPDIMATGVNIESARGNATNNTTITSPTRATISGTSMATPITAGSTALLRQYFTDGFYPTGSANEADSHIPTGPLMKAVLINGAGIDGGHFDKDIGWGRVFLSNSILFDDSEKQLRVWEVANANGLKTGESMEFSLDVLAGQPLAVTLVWYDVPGPLGSSKTLVNDIDLEVIANGQTYRGNVFSDIAVSGTGGTRDSINTVEQVRIPTPTDGNYTIRVIGANIPGDEEVNSFRQGFALVATGSIGSSQSTLDAIANLTANVQGDTGIQLSWSGGDNADYFEIYKVEGSCNSADFSQLRYTGKSNSSTFFDTRTLNGRQYAYKIRPATSAGLGSLSSACVEVTSEQACDFLPTFSQSSIQVVDNVGDLCHTKLQWNTATSNCATSPNIKYNIYRSTDSEFLPSSENLLTTVSTTTYDDIRAPDDAAYYIIRAEDNNPNGTGPNGGTETQGTSRIRSQAIGEGVTNSPVFEDVDTVAIMNLNFPWQVVSDKAADGIFSYKTGEGQTTYPDSACSAMVSNTLTLSPDLEDFQLSYKALYSLEENWDGVVVEISTDNGNTWSDLPPDGGYPSSFSETVIGGNGEYINGCHFPNTREAFSGSNNDGNDTFQTFTHDLSPYSGQDVKVRWVLSTDSNTVEEGFYLDSISYPNVAIPNACTINTAPDKPQAGLYYDRAKNGHGFAIEPIANSDLYFTIFYSYKADGTPEWYSSTSTLENNVLNINMDNDTLLRTLYDYSVDPAVETPFVLDNSVGTNILKIDFNSAAVASSAACNDGQTRDLSTLALATWRLGDQTGEWCIEALINSGNFPTPDFGGIWYAGEQDRGWGLSMTFQNDTIVPILYYYDADGNARWAIGTQSGFVVGQPMTIDMQEIQGYARDASAIDLVGTSAGSLTLTLNNANQNENDGSITVDMTYQGTEGGTWQRTNIPFRIFTEPH